VLAKLSACDVDIKGKLEVETQNSIISGTFMISHQDP
jgi:hypothetical protein